MVKTRAFIAVNLPQSLKQKLGNWVEELKKNLNGGIKWVNPGNLHLTLHFLGYLDARKLDLVKQILKNTVRPSASIALKIKHISCFPHQNRPRVLFFECQEKQASGPSGLGLVEPYGSESQRSGGGNYLINLQKIIGQELKRINIKVDDRPWRTHLTFARIKKPLSSSRDKNVFVFLKKNASLLDEGLKFRVNSIDLMKSELYRLGPKYSILKRFQLK